MAPEVAPFALDKALISSSAAARDKSVSCRALASQPLRPPKTPRDGSPMVEISTERRERSMFEGMGNMRLIGAEPPVVAEAVGSHLLSTSNKDRDEVCLRRPYAHDQLVGDHLPAVFVFDPHGCELLVLHDRLCDQLRTGFNIDLEHHLAEE